MSRWRAHGYGQNNSGREHVAQSTHHVSSARSDVEIMKETASQSAEPPCQGMRQSTQKVSECSVCRMRMQRIDATVFTCSSQAAVVSFKGMRRFLTYPPEDQSLSLSRRVSFDAWLERPCATRKSEQQGVTWKLIIKFSSQKT